MNFKRETLNLNNGKAELINIQTGPENTLTKENLKEFEEILAEIKKNDSIKGAIISSENPKFFCNGLDGDTLLSKQGDELLQQVLSICKFFKPLLQFDKPLVTEVTGHAMGGGAVITMASDYKYMLDSGCRISFSEVLVGLPLPAIFVYRIQECVHPTKINEICMEATAYKGKEAKEVGMIDEVASTREDLRKLSTKKLDSIFRLPLIGVRLTKQNINRKSLFEFDENLKETGNLINNPGILANLKEGMLAVKEKRRPVFT
ncbi:MAG: enoyl-CoA hydratase/isomerase family protein [Leptospira sp.]|nr:enoyl-CoA hydratase/isomerase family protein [Leptospira sp.]